MDWSAIDAELNALGKDDAAQSDVRNRHRPDAPLRLSDVDAELDALSQGVVAVTTAVRRSTRPPASVRSPVSVEDDLDEDAALDASTNVDEDDFLDVNTREVMVDMNFDDEASDQVQVVAAGPSEDISGLLDQVSVIDDMGTAPVVVEEAPRALSVAPSAADEFPEVIAEPVLDDELDAEEMEAIERASVHPTFDAAGEIEPETRPSLSVSGDDDDDDDIPSLEDRLASLEAPGTEGEFEMLLEEEFVSFDQTGMDDAHGADTAVANPSVAPEAPPAPTPSAPPPTEPRPSERKGLLKKIFGD